MTTFSETQDITIRNLDTIDDLNRVEEAQRLIWMMQEPVQIVPAHLLITAEKNGGLVAGAFDPQGELLGFVFGFIGLTPAGKFKHCSHMLGVMSSVRRQGIGRVLKLYQREYVSAQGFDLITWTVDPLEGVNASLNIARLGGIVHTYYENLYGNLTDRLNNGLPTDRFEIEWWINSQRVEQFVQDQREHLTHTQFLALGAELVNATRLDDEGVLNLEDCRLDLNAEVLLVEVPSEFQAMKVAALEAALRWRQQTAAIFTHYFSQGYVITDFISDRDDNYRRNFYVLTPAPQMAGR